jgi:hypothetical protein
VLQRVAARNRRCQHEKDDQQQRTAHAPTVGN